MEYVHIEAYDLSMSFDPPARRFEGRVRIELTSDTDPLVLDAVDLALGEASVDGHPVALKPVPVASQVRLPTGDPGRHEVRLEFRGEIPTDRLVGMYVSPYGPGGEILTTQLQPNWARRLFPCVDHPAAKATFRLEVSVPEAARVVFNTAAVEERREGGRRKLRFAATPRMSPYLLYLGIGPFEETAAGDGSLRIVVAHPPGRSASAAFALEHAARYLRAYEAYYDIPYPLGKLHLVAIPAFWAGATENWGAIAFRENSLLVDAGTNATQRRRNRVILCHEIAHQWFGNLVTNADWNDFWLNEAFATFLSYRIVDRCHPGESTWSDFVHQEMARGLAQDALSSSHPILVEVRDPSQLHEMADGITYGKGASVLRMIEAYLGEETFRRGVRRYLNDHRYEAVTSADLWAALDAESGVPVSRIMREWVSRAGHPVVDLRREAGDLIVAQHRFHADGHFDPATWPVPIVVEIDRASTRLLLEATPVRLPFPPGATLRGNPDRTGFYHVRYFGELGRSVVERWHVLSEIDQWGLLVDRLAFLSNGDGTLDEYLDVIGRAEHSDRYLPSITAARQLQGLRWLGDVAPTLRMATGAFFRTQFERIGRRRRPGESETVGVLRTALGWGTVLDPTSPARRDLADAYRNDPTSVDGDLRSVATVAYVLEGGPEAFGAVWRELRGTKSEKEITRLATALPYASDPECFARTLSLIEEPGFPVGRRWEVLAAATGAPEHAGVLWSWLQPHLRELEAQWGGTPFLGNLLSVAIPRLGLGRSEALSEFFQQHRFPEAAEGITEGLEGLRLREILRARLAAESGT